MIILLSPAKTLDYESPAPLKKHSEPEFASESLKLIGLLKQSEDAGIAEIITATSSAIAASQARMQSNIINKS